MATISVSSTHSPPKFYVYWFLYSSPRRARVACRIPCHKTFIAHYEHALADPQAFLEPLAAFLELAPAAKMVSHLRVRVLLYLVYAFTPIHLPLILVQSHLLILFMV
jgi:hypothetical protein